MLTAVTIVLQWFTLQVDNKPSVVPQDLPSQWSSSMAPIDATKEAEPTGYSLGRHDRRSAFRKAFCKAILDKTRELFQGLGNIKNVLLSGSIFYMGISDISIFRTAVKE